MERIRIRVPHDPIRKTKIDGKDYVVQLPIVFPKDGKLYGFSFFAEVPKKFEGGGYPTKDGRHTYIAPRDGLTDFCIGGPIIDGVLVEETRRYGLLEGNPIPTSTEEKSN